MSRKKKLLVFLYVLAGGISCSGELSYEKVQNLGSGFGSEITTSQRILEFYQQLPAWHAVLQNRTCFRIKYDRAKYPFHCLR